MSEIKLKPCPFCGGKAGTSHGVEAQNEFLQFCFVACEKCGGRTRNFYRWFDAGEYESEAIKAWNTRKPIEDIVEQLEASETRMWGVSMLTAGEYILLERAIEIVRGGAE